MNTEELGERLDRLDARVENLDTRLARVEQILPTLASKKDLEAFATKKDLEAFATKKDLEAFATKKDLEAFATKKDLEAFATKKDLEAFATKRDLERYPTREDLAAEFRAFADREGAAMREFVLDVVRKSAADTRAEMRMLFEVQNAKIDAVIDLHRAELARISNVDAGARERDAALDQRVSHLERQSGRR